MFLVRNPMPNVKKNAMSHAFLTIHTKICLLHNIKRETNIMQSTWKEGSHCVFGPSTASMVPH